MLANATLVKRPPDGFHLKCGPNDCWQNDCLTNIGGYGSFAQIRKRL